MTQYLLSVYMIDGQEPPSEEEITKMYADVDAVNEEIKEAGAWVFAGGLHPATTATVVREDAGEVLLTDGPFAETKEQLGGFWVIEAADLDAALAWARKATVACAPRSRCARSRTCRSSSPRCRLPQPRSSRSSARSPARRSPPWCVSSATSTSPKRRSRRRS